MAERGETGAKSAIRKAAAKIFAARGFRAATVRDICAEAGANIALVSRYFGSKRELYAEVCRRLFDGLAAPLARLDRGVATSAGWQAAVREWIRRALSLTSATRSPAKEIAGIFRQEMFAPSPVYGYLRETFMMPVFNCLKNLVEMGGGGSAADTLWHMSRIWSQIVFYAVVDPAWRTDFRPRGMSRAAWLSVVADNLASDAFLRLRYIERQS